jgi:hypothetical protein
VRYSQPFGTPAPPLGQYPRYINGDPITGTEGSIPPGTAFDEDQIEIVNVIENVRALGLIGSPGPPSHSDLTQLWQAMNAFFNRQYITTPITKTVHGAGADFADLNAALDWASRYIITPTGYVTFLVSPGKWTYHSNLNLDHPNMSRIAIQGAPLNANPAGNQFSYNGYHNSTDGTNHAIYLRACFQTELNFDSGTTGFLVTRGGAMLRYLLITGNLNIGSQPGTIVPFSKGWGSGIEVYTGLNLDGVAVWGFGNSGIYMEQGWLATTSALSIICSYNNYSGIYAVNSAIFFARGGTGQSPPGPAQLILVSNYVCGFLGRAGLYYLGKCYVRGNDTAGGPAGLGGITSTAGAQIQAGYQSVIANNRSYGMWSQGGWFVGHQTTYTGNGTGGVYIYGTSTGWCNDSVFSGNGGNWDMASVGNSFCEVLRSSISPTRIIQVSGGLVDGP